MKSASLIWITGLIKRDCVVCGYTGEQNHIATAKTPGNPTALIARCNKCGCVLLGDPYPPTENLDYWTDYIETTAGIEAIASYFALVESEKSSRFLDVGCGYGFGLDLAQVTKGWVGVGVDPSVGGRMGARELKVDIRDGRLDASLGTEGKFDVIMMSEVLEHVSDPRGLLRTAQQLLADDGIFIVTTPNADVVSPDRKNAEVLMALAIGDHQFLTTTNYLKIMLEDAGFVNIEIDSSTNTLVALAALNLTGLAKSRLSSGYHAVKVDEYLEYRGGLAPEGSALAVGMWARLIQSKVFGGEIDAANSFVPRLRAALLSRYQVDIDDPVLMKRLKTPPAVLTQICYLIGFIFFVKDQFALAAEYFRASLNTISRYDVTHRGQPIPAPVLFQIQALGHLALALATTDKRGSQRALKKLDQLVVGGVCDVEVADDFRARALILSPATNYFRSVLSKIIPNPIKIRLRKIRGTK